MQWNRGEHGAFGSANAGREGVACKAAEGVAGDRANNEVHDDVYG